MKNEDLHSYILTVYSSVTLTYNNCQFFNSALWFLLHCDTTMLSDEFIYTVYK